MKGENKFLVLTESKALAFIKAGFIPFTIEDIEKAKKEKNGFIGRWLHVDYYILKPF